MRSNLCVRIAAMIFTVAAATAAGQTLSPEERDRAIGELESSRRDLLAAVASLSPAQWAFKPAPDRWSIVECLEHVALAEDSYFRTITERLPKAKPQPEKAAEQLLKHVFII